VFRDVSARARDRRAHEGYPQRFPVRLTTLPTDPPLGHNRDHAPEQRPPSPLGRRVTPPYGPGVSRVDDAVSRALAAGLASVRDRIASATPVGQPPPLLLPVTKSVSAETALALAGHVLAARDAGTPRDDAVVELGESRAADLARKVEHFRAAGVPARWHFLGHVQRNKARRIVALADVIQSLDSLRLAETLERAATDAGKVLDVFVQVDFTGEATKTGLDADGAREVLRYVVRAPHLRPLGLMAMGPLAERPGHTTPEVFARVAALARELEADPEFAGTFPDSRAQLSLGMSGDLEPAIAAGSTLVRVGSDLFRHLVPETPPAADGGADDLDQSSDDQSP
jgi:pyridoxal phosphate enzyme (YggS family)